MAHKQKPTLSSRVSDEIMERIDALVERTGVPRAEVIERALLVGIKDQEDFVGAVEGKVTGPLMSLLMSEKFLNVMYLLTGDEADPHQLQAVKNVRARWSGKLSGRVAAE